MDDTVMAAAGALNVADGKAVEISSTTVMPPRQVPVTPDVMLIRSAVAIHPLLLCAVLVGVWTTVVARIVPATPPSRARSVRVPGEASEGLSAVPMTTSRYTVPPAAFPAGIASVSTTVSVVVAETVVVEILDEWGRDHRTDGVVVASSSSPVTHVEPTRSFPHRTTFVTEEENDRAYVASLPDPIGRTLLP